MLKLEFNITEIILGIIIFGLGLLYLMQQNKTLGEMTQKVCESVVDQENLYQQYSDINLNNIPAEELCSVIIGYREYPISIDGSIMAMDEVDYEKYLLLVKDGYYIKSYQYNADRKLIQVNYMHSSEF